MDGFSNCVAVLALNVDTSVSWARRFTDFLGVCSSLAHMAYNVSLGKNLTLMFLFLVYEEFRSKFIRQIMKCLSAGKFFVTNCASKFSSRSVFHVRVIQKYTLPWSTPHLDVPHCSPCNIILSSGPQVTYLHSCQTLSDVRHADSSAKFVCASQHAAHRPPWSAES
jgi:hypothetical protein